MYNSEVYMQYKDTDIGLAIYHKKSQTYYCGLNQWDRQLRKAKFYHKEKYLMEWLTNYCNDKAELVSEYEIHEIALNVVSTKQL